MALLMGRFFPAKMSTKCGGRHSSSASDLLCSSLQLGAVSITTRCAAPVSAQPVVSRGGLGADDALVGVVLSDSDVGYGCLTDLLNLDSQGTVLPLQLALPTC